VDNTIFNRLNGENKEERLAAAREAAGELRAEPTEEVNNHVHTTYSFSPYFPAMAAYKAREAGLKAVGIMDHDSISGADEMLQACKLIGIASTAGFELRTNFTGTKIEGRRINSPDSLNIGYIVIHGIPKGRFPEVRAFLRPLQEERNLRNAAMVDKLNDVITPAGLDPVDFREDVYPLSQAADGGTITERHILYAFAEKCTAEAGRGKGLVTFLREKFQCTVEGRLEEYLSDTNNPHYLYDLIGLFKTSFLPRVFIQPNGRECIPVKEVVDFGNSIDAIPAYAYLGDVTDSPTGDKKAQKFEDDYLVDVLDTVKELGFKAVTYMPPRNTRRQLARIQKMCGEYGLMEISGVDVNSSRQTFNCPIILEPEFRHLTDAAWALIAHEKCAEADPSFGLFHPGSPYAALPLPERTAKYSEIGRKIDQHEPEKAAELIM
jgi:hypothetical protein